MGSGGGGGGGYSGPSYTCRRCRSGADTPFCTQCGSEIYSDDKVRVCSRCGNHAGHGEAFCSECGGRVEERTVRNRPHPISPSGVGEDIFWNAQITCGNCGNGGTEYSAKKFCTKCGRKEWKLKSRTFWECRRCSHQITHEAKCCPACGNDMAPYFRTREL